MANIPIKRGQQTVVSLEYSDPGETNNFNFYTTNARYTATLVLRRKVGTSVTDDLVDTLNSETSGSSQNTAGRIRFINIGNGGVAATDPNIILRWETSDSIALPNEAITIYGDLKIKDTNQNPDEVIQSFRLTFDIIPEII